MCLVNTHCKKQRISTVKQRMGLFEKDNKIGNRFTSENQPQNRGRKPSVYKYIKKLSGKRVDPLMSKTPLWVLNVISAINTDIRYGRTSTVEMLFDRVFGKPTQAVESDVKAEVTSNGVDLSGLSTEELLQYNALLEKIKSTNGSK